MGTKRCRSFALLVAAAVVAVSVSALPATAAQAAPLTVDVFVIGSSAGGVFPILNEANAGVALSPRDRDGCWGDE
jgi:hypothetical protein